MHIPDGYLGPITWVALWVIMLPFWVIAARKLKKDLSTKQVPLLAIGAAFSFVIMMFNFPVFGGSTGHAVGGTLIAIILGPWAAVVAETVALVIQALFFGDGGITAIGANCFNMGVVLPFVGYYIYKMISRNAAAQSRRHWIGAAVGSYVGINVAAVYAGLELGLQPLLYPAVNGQFAYFMYPIAVSVPVMLFEHLVAFGPVETIVTTLVVVYLQRTDPSMLGIPAVNLRQEQLSENAKEGTGKKSLRGLGILVIILVIAAPLGIYFAGTAYGEWGPVELQKMLGYIPSGIQQGQNLWQAPLAGYGLTSLNPNVGYWLAAGVGVAIIIIVTIGLGKVVVRKRVPSNPIQTTTFSAGVKVKMKRQHNFVENTLVKIANLLETSIFSEKYASESGLLQRIDPRVKLISLFCFLIAVNLFQNIYAILAVYVVILLLAVLSKVPLGFFAKRVWVFVPIFAGVIALPAIFNIFTPGDSLVVLFRYAQVQQFWGFQYTEISITRQGVLGAIFFMLRVGTSVSLVVLLTLTTHWANVLKALRSLGVPQVFILVLSMTYQYVLVLARQVQDMHVAKKARTIPHWQRRADAKGERAWVASRIGTVLRKSYATIDEIHMSMLARGFRGDVKIFQLFALRKVDFAWIAIAGFILISVIWLNFMG